MEVHQGNGTLDTLDTVSRRNDVASMLSRLTAAVFPKARGIVRESPMIAVPAGCRRQALVIIAAVACEMCGGGPAPRATRELRGRVWDGEGVPVAHATVQAKDSAGLYSLSDESAADGSFHLSVPVPQPPVGGTEVLIKKTGYEDAYGWVAGTIDAESALLIRRIVVLAPGDEIHLTVTPDASLCGATEKFRCRTVRVVSASAGTLVLETISDNQSAPVWLALGGPLELPSPFAGVTRLSVPISAGETKIVKALRPWNLAEPQSFTLKTALEHH